jgi:lauroyl/myristoyl acyltransferase
MTVPATPTDEDNRSKEGSAFSDESEGGQFSYKSVARVGPPDCGDPVLFYRRTTRYPDVHGLISPRDAAEAAIYAIMAAAAAVRPPEAWPGLCHRTAQFGRARRIRNRVGAFGDSMRAVLGDVSDHEIEVTFDRWWENLHRRRMMLVREYVGHGPVRFTYTGRDHLDAALALGRGAILWVAEFIPQTLAGKRGLFESGIRAHQVSALFHGFRNSRFGNVFLNQPLVRAENRYLAGRLVFESDEAGMLVRRMMRVLKSGECVIITNNLYAGRSFVQMPFGVRGFTNMATTPIVLALMSKVPLLYMSTVEREPLAHYEIRFSRDLAAEEIAAGAGSDDFAAIARIALGVRDELLTDLRKAPDQYRDWLPHARPIVRES